ncbi:SPFH domain-containing protein, partial [Parapedobacter defluvii]|uniref:SPFH domain-containing protein n=1 Tax=Parapedobacter defluvii TaxID=2045106 RepID=UPI0033403EF1
IIEWVEHQPNLMMWKIPDGDKEIKNGAKLVVRESQAAMLMNEGQVADIFPAGTHTLRTENIPLLSRLKGWKYGFESPFKADVYFFSIKQFVNLKWGTPAPVIMRDPQFGQVRIRAFGTYNVRITEPATFFKEYAGTFPQLTSAEFEHQLRDFIAPKFGEALALSNISVLDIASNLSALNSRIQPLIKPYFDDFGVEITTFTVTNANLPDEVTQYYDKVTGMNMAGNLDNFQKFNTAIATSNDSNPVQGGVQQGVAMGMLFNQLGQTQAPPQPTPAATPSPPAASSAQNDVETVASRLKALKALFEDNLIDEAEYKAKKAALIELL